METLAPSRTKEAPYSRNPRTECPKGGLHLGRILDKCSQCQALLTFQDFEIRAASRGTLHQIKCKECGDMREVKPQDVHQVTRCKPCQAKHSGKSFKKFLSKVRK